MGTDAMISEYTVQRRVVFSDTDTAGMLHFSQFFIYMEDCEHEFLKSLGQSVFVEQAGVKEGWPRVDARCNFRKALQFNDVIEIKLLLRRIGSKSLQYQFQMRKAGEEDLCALGEMTAVFVRGYDSEAQKPITYPLPAELLQQIECAAAEDFCNE